LLYSLETLMLMAPLPLPFSNTFPAYGILFLAVGTLERDGYVVLAGYLMVLLSVSYLAAVVAIGTTGMQKWWPG
jgi:hypothetical protein